MKIVLRGPWFDGERHIVKAGTKIYERKFVAGKIVPEHGATLFYATGEMDGDRHVFRPKKPVGYDEAAKRNAERLGVSMPREWKWARDDA